MSAAVDAGALHPQPARDGLPVSRSIRDGLVVVPARLSRAADTETALRGNDVAGHWFLHALLRADHDACVLDRDMRGPFPPTLQIDQDVSRGDCWFCRAAPVTGPVVSRPSGY